MRAEHEDGTNPEREPTYNKALYKTRSFMAALVGIHINGLIT